MNIFFFCPLTCLQYQNRLLYPFGYDADSGKRYCLLFIFVIQDFGNHSINSQDYDYVVFEGVFLNLLVVIFISNQYHYYIGHHSNAFKVLKVIIDLLVDGAANFQKVFCFFLVLNLNPETMDSILNLKFCWHLFFYFKEISTGSLQVLFASISNQLNSILVVL